MTLVLIQVHCGLVIMLIFKYASLLMLLHVDLEIPKLPTFRIK